MIAEQVIVSVLNANGTVAGLRSTRMYPGLRAQAVTTLPYQVYTRVDTVYAHAMVDAAHHTKRRIQIDSFASTPGGAAALAAATASALDGYRGNVVVGAETVYVESCLLVSDNSGLLPAPGSDAGIWRESHDYEIVLGPAR